MAYSDLLENEGISSQFLVVMKPRRIEDSFILVSGSVYKKTFTRGHVVSVAQNGSALTEAASTTLSAGEFFWDFDNSELYVRMSDSSNPSTKTVVVTFELYFGTFDAHWYRDPLDDTTRVVYFEPLVKKSPILKSSVSDTVFGYMPVTTSQLVLSNASHFLESNLYDTSFNASEVKIYHYLGDVSLDSVKLVYVGVCGSYSYNNSETSFKLEDRHAVLENEYRHENGASFFAKTSFPGLDPNYQARPIRAVFGVVEGFVPVNIDYVQDSPTTSDNRDWVCINGQSNLGNIVTTVSASPSSTTTRTYVASVSGFMVGDRIWLDSGSPEYGEVTDVGANYIDHTSFGSAAVSGDSLKRGFVGSVDVLSQGVRYKCFYGRDYTLQSFADNTSGFSFTTTLEANISLPATITTSDKVVAKIYGPKVYGTLPTPSANDSTTGNMSLGIDLLYKMVERAIGPGTNLDISTFASAKLDNTHHVGFSIPSTANENFPLYKDLIVKLCQTLLARVFVNNNNNWVVSLLAPLGAFDKTTDDTEILVDSFSYGFEYSDLISTSIVEYQPKEADPSAKDGAGTVATVISESNRTKWLHKKTKQATTNSLHILEAEAQILADRLLYYFGERGAKIELDLKNRFFDLTLGQVLRVSRTRMPGFDYDSELERTRDFVVVETNKGLNKIQVTLDDQKGIEDNEGLW